MALHWPLRLESGEDELLDQRLERHAVLQRDRDQHGEAVHHAAKGGALLVHIDEDLAQFPVLVFARAQEDLVSADFRFLRNPVPLRGQPTPRRGGQMGRRGRRCKARFGHPLRLRRRQIGEQREQRVGKTLRVLRQRRVLRLRVPRRQRLRLLAAVPVDGDRLEPQPPRLAVDPLHVGDRRFVGHVDGLGDCAGEERLRGRHHAHVAHRLDEPSRQRPAAVGAVEHAVVLRLEERSTLHRLASADDERCGIDLLHRVAELLQHGLALRGWRKAEPAEARCAQDVRGERRPQIEHRLQGLLDLGDLRFRQAARKKLLRGEAGDALQRRRAADVVDDRLHLARLVAELLQRPRDALVDDLERPSTRELLELDEREVGLHARRVAVHQQTDGPGGREDRRLRVAVAVLLSQSHGAVPHLVRRPQKPGGREVAIDVLHRVAVHAHHLEHRVAVQRISLERSLASGHLGGKRVRLAGHHRRHRCGIGAARIRVVGQPLDHQQRAEVRVAEA